MRSALTNTTSDQWPYLHKNLIFLVITSILKYVVFRLMQTCRSPVINFLLQGAPNSLVFYDGSDLTMHQLVGLPFSLHRIHTRSHRVRKVVKVYNRAYLGGTHDIFGRRCATIKSLYRPFLEFLTKKLDPFRNFCA